MLDEAGDVVGAAAFADEHDLAGIGIGDQREIAVASPIGRLVDGEAREPRQVGPGEGEIDIAAANACTRCQLSPIVRTTAAKGIC